MTDTLTELEKVREALAIAFYNVHVPCSHTDSHGWHTYCHTLADIALDTIIAQQKATEEVMEAVRVRLVQIASGDYRACGHLAEAVALDALDKINTILKEPTNE